MARVASRLDTFLIGGEEELAFYKVVVEHLSYGSASPSEALDVAEFDVPED